MLLHVFSDGFAFSQEEHGTIAQVNTLMCLSIGTPKTNKFSICSKWKIHYFRCPKIKADGNLIIMCLNIGTPKKH